MDDLILKAIGPILAAIGSIVLAMRIEKIIDAVLIGIDANQNAIRNLPGGDSASTELQKSHIQVQQELRKGKKILFWGFSALALGGIVNALSYFIN